MEHDIEIDEGNADDEDDEDIVDIDEEDCEPRLSKRGALKHEAKTTEHLLLVETTTCLLEAGSPPCFWRRTIRCVSHLLNVEPDDQEVSAWCKLHVEEFKGSMIPFGALVCFKPSGARSVEQKHKFDPMGIPGVFAGYDLAPGLRCLKSTVFGLWLVGQDRMPQYQS